MQLTSSRTVDDAFYDQLNIQTNNASGTVEVSGEQVPTVAITRRDESALNESVPIGSRDTGGLAMMIEGKHVEIRPGGGKLTRGSYRVDLTYDGTRYAFKPKSTVTAQLVRDGTKTVELSMSEEGDFINLWLITRAESYPSDAAIGYALSVAFGTGAMGVFSLLMSLPDMLIPG